MSWAIDPGTTKSAIVIIDDNGIPACWAIESNEVIAGGLRTASTSKQVLAVEMVQSFGMPVGKETFETVLWVGRFIEAWRGPYRLLYRTTVKGHVCGSARAKDPNVRQALIDRYGGKDTAIGKKASPGPLYGFKSHLWSALAVGITAREVPGECSSGYILPSSSLFGESAIGA